MFDIATRIQPAGAADTRRMAVPFDWRLTAPDPMRDHEWTDYSDPSGLPHAYVTALKVYALALEDTLQTAITISLFTDARATADDPLPRNARHRRGWLGNQVLGEPDDNWGSLLWLHYVGKSSAQVLEAARFAAQEALAWLVRDGIASRVSVSAEWVSGTAGSRLAVRPQVYRPDQPSPVYDVLWSTSIARGESQ